MAFRSPQSAVRSPQVRLGLVAAALSTLWLASDITSQGPVTFPHYQAKYSTHDVVLPGQSQADDMRWIDVKTPGDGSTYVAGTANVRTTLATPSSPLFSGEPIAPAGNLPTFAFSLSQPYRQVGIVQWVDSNQGIGPFASGQPRQRFFYGESGNQVSPDFSRATHVRAISVWPTGDATTTRVAICGETYDERLPLFSTYPTTSGAPHADGTHSGGFIAVFDGQGNLKWTHHFYGGTTDGNCAVTDLSIRVEVRGTGAFDVVTYCGVSSHGNPSSNFTLDDVQPWVLTTSVCPNIGVGDTDNGVSQWDGFVGRLERSPSTSSGPGGTTTMFHSVVGGEDQDGLFGIAEVTPDRFIVVGSSGRLSGTGGSGFSFPILSGTCPVGSQAPYSVGVMLLFQLQSGYPILESSRVLGTASQNRQTVARDVLVQPGYRSGFPLATVVGSTDDPALLTSLSVIVPGVPTPFAPVLGPKATIGSGGNPDGFVFCAQLNPPSSLQPSPTPVAATFHGGNGVDGLTGVGGWNEFVDHFTDLGFEGSDIRVASYAIDSDGSAAARPIVPMTDALIGGGALDEPTATAFVQCLTRQSTLWDVGTLGDPAGGGVSVDSTGRINAVGTTVSANYPTTPAGLFPAGRAKVQGGFNNNGVRTVFDLLPSMPVGRTDGTGLTPTTGISYPPVGWFGGTTPECALSPLGQRVGDAVPPLRRILIDCNAATLSTGQFALDLVVTRTPASGLQVSAWHLGFPGSGAFTAPAVLPGGALLYAANAPVTVAITGSDETLRAVFALPAGHATFTVQLVVLALVPGGAIGPAPCPAGGTSDFVASPGLWFTY